MIAGRIGSHRGAKRLGGIAEYKLLSEGITILDGASVMSKMSSMIDVAFRSATFIKLGIVSNS